MAVSLEQLQASIIRATLSPSKVTQATPPGTNGVWSALAGVSREGHQDGGGDDAFQPADFFCKVSLKRVVQSTSYLFMGLAFSTYSIIVVTICKMPYHRLGTPSVLIWNFTLKSI